MHGSTGSTPVRTFTIKSSAHDSAVHEGEKRYVHVSTSKIQMFLQKQILNSCVCDNIISHRPGPKVASVTPLIAELLHVPLPSPLACQRHFDGMVLNVISMFSLRVIVCLIYLAYKGNCSI